MIAEWNQIHKGIATDDPDTTVKPGPTINKYACTENLFHCPFGCLFCRVLFRHAGYVCQEGYSAMGRRQPVREGVRAQGGEGVSACYTGVAGSVSGCRLVRVGWTLPVSGLKFEV